MNYSKRFKNYLLITLKGYLIGLAASAAFIIIVELLANVNLVEYIPLIFILSVPAGLIVSVILAYKEGDSYILGDSLSNILDGIKNLFFGSVFSANTIYIGAILLIVGAIKIVIGLVVFSVVALFAGVTYVLNFVYYFIMCILEKCHLLDGKERLCNALDKMVLVLSVACVIGIIYFGYKYYTKTY